MEDVELVYLDIAGVRADGTVDLTMKTGHVTWKFWSRKIAAARPAALAKNAEYRAQCVVLVEAATTGVEVVRASDLCEGQVAVVPRCTFRQLWARAQKKGADPAYVAEIQLIRGAWELAIHNVPKRGTVSFTFKDDCR